MDESRGKTFQEEIKIIFKYIEARENQKKGGKAEKKEEGLKYSRKHWEVGEGKRTLKKISCSL